MFLYSNYNYLQQTLIYANTDTLLLYTIFQTLTQNSAALGIGLFRLNVIQCTLSWKCNMGNKFEMS